MRIDDDLRDRVRVFQACVAPRLAGVGRFVHAVAGNKGIPNVGFTRPGVDRFWIRGRDRERADAVGPFEPAVRDIRPGQAVVRGAPHAAVDTAEVEGERRARHRIDGDRAPADSRTDVAPVQRRDNGLRARQRGLGRGGKCGKHERCDECERRSSCHTQLLRRAAKHLQHARAPATVERGVVDALAVQEQHPYD